MQYFLDKQSSIVPRNEHLRLASEFPRRSALARPPLSEGHVERVIEACGMVPEDLRAGFLQNGFYLMLQSRNFELDECLRVIEMAAGNMAGPRNVLPQETLKFFSTGVLGYCEKSEPRFGKESEYGRLIEAEVFFNGSAMKVHVKGFLAYVGKTIAKPADAPISIVSPYLKELAWRLPEYPLYSIKIKDGIIMETAIARYDG